MTNWDEYDAWATPKFPRKGAAMVINRNAVSQIDPSDKRKILIESHTRDVWSVWKAMLRPIARVFKDHDDAQCVYVEFVDDPDNPEFTATRVGIFGRQYGVLDPTTRDILEPDVE